MDIALQSRMKINLLIRLGLTQNHEIAPIITR